MMRSNLQICSVVVFLLGLLAGVDLSASTIRVPAEQSTIQTGVDAAAVGDTVLVAPGRYTGEGNRDIDFGGKDIVVKSENGPQVTIIDCERLGRGFYFHSGEDASAVVEGFTITNGYAQDGFIPPVMFAGLHRYGGAIFCDSSGPTIRGNVIYGNRTWEYTGGIESGGVGDGGGIGCYKADPYIIGNVLTDNYAPGAGDGMACYESTPTIVNSIIRDGMSTHATGVPDPIVGYCNIEGGWTGEGVIDQDPHFVAPSEFCFNVCSESPCIDAGDPSVTDPDGSRSDIGLHYSEHPECLYGTRNVWYVSVSGSDMNGNGSSDNPLRTIQQGIRMATDGDTVLVYPGVYHENVSFAGSDVVLMSMNIKYDPSTIPLNTVISGVDWPGKPATVTIASGEGHGAVVQGFVIENGVPGFEISDASPTISDNLIRNNGQGISCSNTTAQIVRSIISDNHAPCGTDGGGIACADSANITALNCTITLNSVNRWLTEPEIDCADIGSAVFADESLPIFSHCIVAFNYVVSWAPVCCAVVGPVQLEHCNAYGNQGGDWMDWDIPTVDCNGVFSVNPLFCDSASSDYHISSESLCTPENSACGALVGALGVGCSDRCCGVYNHGRTGNTNCGTDGKVTLADITRLIDFIYISKKTLCCERSGNTDGSEDGKIALSDVTRLVDNVYISKEPSEPCL